MIPEDRAQAAEERGCARCGQPISLCFGYVKAGDMLEFWDGVRLPAAVRELCGLCATMYRWRPDGTLERYTEAW